MKMTQFSVAHHLMFHSRASLALRTSKWRNLSLATSLAHCVVRSKFHLLFRSFCPFGWFYFFFMGYNESFFILFVFVRGAASGISCAALTIMCYFKRKINIFIMKIAILQSHRKTYVVRTQTMECATLTMNWTTSSSSSSTAAKATPFA